MFRETYRKFNLYTVFDSYAVLITSDPTLTNDSNDPSLAVNDSHSN